MQSSRRKQVRQKPDPVLPRVGVYIRVSSGEQARTGFSLEFQEARCLEWCQFRYGPDGYSHKVYRDEGRSGTLGLRPPGVRVGQYRDGLTQMVRDIEAGLLDTVVFFRLDRLSRSPRLTHSLLEDVFKKYDVGITSITEGFDASSKEGRMLVGILASVASYYLDCLAENITEGLRTRKAKGKYSTTPPFGWRWKESVGPDGQVQRGDAIEVVPEEAKWVMQMAEWVLAGWGTPKIARELNRLGVKTHNDKQWGATRVRNLLSSPVHCGMMWAGEKLVEGEHAAMRIYEPETREAILRAFAGRASLPSRTKGAVHVLLGGLATCGNCRRRLMVHYGPASKTGKEPRLSYRCRGNERVGEGQCRGFTVGMQSVDEWLTQRVLEFAASPQMMRKTERAARQEATVDRDRLERDAAQLRKRLEEMELRFERWAEALEGGAMTVEQFKRRNLKMLSEKKEAEAALAEAEEKLRAQSEHQQMLAEVQKALKDLPGVWEHLEPEERKEVLGLLIEDMQVSGRPGEGKTARIRLRYGPTYEAVL